MNRTRRILCKTPRLPLRCRVWIRWREREAVAENPAPDAVVDDDESVRIAMRRLLRSAHFDVEMFPSGAMARATTRYSERGGVALLISGGIYKEMVAASAGQYSGTDIKELIPCQNLITTSRT